MDSRTREYIRQERSRIISERVQAEGRARSGHHRALKGELRRGEVTPLVFSLLSPPSQEKVKEKVLSHSHHPGALHALMEYEGGYVE